MGQDVKHDPELLSALADGQLRGQEFARTLQWLADSQEARASWHAYHLAGDVLRAPELARTAWRDGDFIARLRVRLQDEGVVRDLDAIPIQASDLTERPGVLSRPGANEEGHGWKLVAGLSSLMVMATIGWQLLAGPSATAPTSSLQASAPSATTDVPAGLRIQDGMVRDPRLDQLLAAHQQFGGTSALQMPSGFLRNATFERPAR